MSLAAGTKVGPYVVEAPLGAGGMGEVYRARDAKLNRDVALKVLSDEFATDSDRRARFQREAQVLASLSHPNIGHIYGFEDSGTVHALVLELVEGATLAERISRHRPQASGPRSGSASASAEGSGLPLPEVLSIAKQIAAALEAAHERGIVHRDLKPANVKVRDDGTVKVLDFGLAKAFDPSDPGRNSDSGELDLANSPTLTSPAGMTRPGVILGTAAYMSPEQARGQVVDKRTDIWAFGCVLFEMLTGRRAFTGDTVSDTIVSILSGEPEWDALPKATPGTVRDLLQRCLEKDPKRRLRDIGDTRFEIDQPGGRSGGVAVVASASKAPRTSRRSLQLIALAIVVVASGAGLFYSTRPSVPVTSPSEYVQITNFSDSAVAPSVSPDGRMVTFKRGSDGFFSTGQIYVKPILGGDAIQLTNDADRKYGPVFTPDSARVTYTTIAMDRPTQFNTRTVRAAGGSQPTELLPNASGLTWIAGQRVLFGEVMGEHFHMATVTASESRADRREIYLPANEGMAHFAYASPNGQSVLVVEMDQSHKFGLPCRLVPFDGSSPGRYVGPRGTCTVRGLVSGRKLDVFQRVRGQPLAPLASEVPRRRAGADHLWPQRRRGRGAGPGRPLVGDIGRNASKRDLESRRHGRASDRGRGLCRVSQAVAEWLTRVLSRGAGVDPVGVNRLGAVDLRAQIDGPPVGKHRQRAARSSGEGLRHFGRRDRSGVHATGARRSRRDLAGSHRSTHTASQDRGQGRSSLVRH